MILVRPATADDAAALAELRWEFRSPRGTTAETHEAFVARCDMWMRGALHAGEWRAWIASAEGRIVGQLWMRTIDKIPNPTIEPERHAYISNVYVTPAARGGAGDRLLAAAIQAAREDGVDTIVLWPTERSRSLYARHGFTAAGRVMELPLANPSDRV